MKRRQLALAASAVMAGGLGSLSVASAATVVTVEALTPIGSFLNTGLTLSPASTSQFSVINPSTLWSAGSNLP